MKKVVFKWIVCLLSLLFLIVLIVNYKDDLQEDVVTEVAFAGRGTIAEPYLIENAEDLKSLRDSVNAGESFDGVYFLQTTNISLKGENWIPIGIFSSDNYFYGTYDGGCHFITDLISDRNDMESANIGLFGELGGTVINLGIESGEISGAYVGSIASHSTGTKAVIANCYNKATVIGTGRAGGICDNFSGGTVMNCANYGEVSAPCTAQIVSYSAKNLVNVYPQENAYSEFFSGVHKQFEIGADASGLQFLNEGLEYIYEYELFEIGVLKEWKIKE